MTEADWNSGPIADLLLHTLDIHRSRYGAEPADSVMLLGPHSAMRGDLGRKHMLLAFAILRQYWKSLDKSVQGAAMALEAFEEPPHKTPRPPHDDFGYIMDLFLEPLSKGDTDSEVAMAMWLVGGWWSEVKNMWAHTMLPVSWRPLFHDVFGNPFRPTPSVDSAWLSQHNGRIRKLAKRMYDSRDFSDMPVLGELLEEVGCNVAAILNHCRERGPHVRGCWVLDLILKKE
jgi:hypothetical protein